MQLVEFPMADIHVEGNDRKVFEEREIVSLAASIAENGLIHPITIRPDGTLVAGERRYRAVRHLKWPSIPALVRDGGDEEASRLKLIENINRVDLNPIEEANAYASRMQAFDLTEEQVAAWANKTPQLVRSRLALLTLREDIQHMVATKNLGHSQAAELVGLDVNRQGIMMKWFQSLDSIPTVAVVRERAAVLRGQQIDEESTFLWEENLLAPPEEAPLPWGRNSLAVAAELLLDDSLPQFPRTYSVYAALRGFYDRCIAAEKEPEARVVASCLLGLIRTNHISDPGDSGRKKSARRRS